MKYGDYNKLYLYGTMTSATQGTMTKESSDKIKSADSGLAFITMTNPLGGTVLFYPVVFMVNHTGTHAILSGVAANGTPKGVDLDLITNTFTMSE